MSHVLLDDREDRSIAERLAPFGISADIVHLDFADLVIEASNGWTVGYERKRFTDLIASMQDRRLSGHQFKGMRDTYDRVELVIEGLWRPGDNGEILVANGGGKWSPLYYRNSGVSYRQLDSYLYSQYEMGGVAVWRTGSTAETAHLYASRYYWWQKDYELHKSHDVIHYNSPTVQRRGAVHLHSGDPNPVTLVAAQIPGIDSKAWDIGKHFSSVLDMVYATEADWRRVAWTDRKGNVKHFGKETAKEIVRWLRGLQSVS